MIVSATACGAIYHIQIYDSLQKHLPRGKRGEDCMNVMITSTGYYWQLGIFPPRCPTTVEHVSMDVNFDAMKYEGGNTTTNPGFVKGRSKANTITHEIEKHEYIAKAVVTLKTKKA
mmetsp:Transcript_39447/g.39888  ORF Transcript_39447/g.39888 Transcript_39447/m.39888 type:complete len:116 (-) Transcript_39447:1147-1494(-)